METEIQIRMDYCTSCPHKAFEHEIAMNTPQSGRCFKCECISLDLPSREELGDEVETLTAQVAELKGEVALLKVLTDVEPEEIKEAVQAERERIAEELEERIVNPHHSPSVERRIATYIRKLKGESQ